MEEESPERRALRELVEAILSQQETFLDFPKSDDPIENHTTPTYEIECVRLANPLIVSAMREAEAVLGRKVKK